MLILDDSTIARFLAKVDRSGGPDACWPWTGVVDRKGYGRFGHSSERAHRIAWMIENGPIDPEKPIIRHKTCDNRPCCNPAHLEDGTHADNVADMDSKGRRRAARGKANGKYTRPDRTPVGAAHGMARLSECDVLAIRARAAAGETNMTALGRAFGISRPHATRIVKRMNWKHVHDAALETASTMSNDPPSEAGRG